MAQVDIHSRATVASALNIQAITTDTTTVGNIIDTQDQHSLELIFNYGTVSAGVLTPLIHEGDNSALSDATVVPTDYLLGTIASATFTFGTSTNNVPKSLGYVGKKRYVRPSIVSTGSANGTVGVIAIKENPGVASVDALS